MLALIWHETPGLPPFEPQWPVDGPDGFFYLDLAVPGLRYAAEYDGAEFHGPDQRRPTRRGVLAGETDGWPFGVFVAEDVAGTGQTASDRLLRDIADARRTFAAASPSRQVTTRRESAASLRRLGVLCGVICADSA